MVSQPATVTVTILEAEARPVAATTAGALGANVVVWALADALDDERHLRTTVLRAEGEHPPPGAQMLFALESNQTRNGLGFRVLRVGRGVTLELVRSDGRSRVTLGPDLRTGSNIEVVLPTQRRVSLTINVTSTVTDDASAAVGATGTRRSQALQAARGVFWLVPSAWAFATDWDDAIKDAFYVVAKRTGVGPRTWAVATAAVAYGIGGAAAWYSEYSARVAAQSAAAEAVEAATNAEAARAEAVRAQSTCIDDRQELLATLQRRDEARAARAEAALALPAARSLAIQLGGTRYTIEPVVAFDALAAQATIRGVVRWLDAANEVVTDLPRCLTFGDRLGSDLPPYALAWHPVHELSCPVNYAGVVGGVPLVGRWGLSPRVAHEFGMNDPAFGPIGDPMPGRDPRMDDRWAVETYTAALRATVSAVTRRPGRVAVAPSQAQLWSLAIFAAYNRLPSPGEGALDGSLSVCVAELLDTLEANAGAETTDAPVLPDFAQVASGDAPLVVSATPGCPWPVDAVDLGVRSALASVGRMAAYEPPEAD